MHSALGLRTLKEQQNHFKIFIEKSKEKPIANKAMKHGTEHEVSLCSRVYDYKMNTN